MERESHRAGRAFGVGGAGAGIGRVAAGALFFSDRWLRQVRHCVSPGWMSWG
jgi:hypothetical protein